MFAGEKIWASMAQVMALVLVKAKTPAKPLTDEVLVKKPASRRVESTQARPLAAETA